MKKLKSKIESFVWSAYSKMGWDDRLTARAYQDQITIALSLITNRRKSFNEIILDAGCGTGNYSLELAKKGFKVIGIDIAQGMLEKALLKTPREFINTGLVSFSQADLNEVLPYPDGYFHHILCMQVFSYVQEPDFTIRELFRVLKPGGSFLVKIMIRQKDESLLGMIKHRIRTTPKENISKLRYYLKTSFRLMGLIGAEMQGQHRWHPEEFEKYITNFGFKIEFTDNCNLFLAVKE